MFIYLAVPGVIRGMQDLVAHPGIEPRPPCTDNLRVLASRPLWECPQNFIEVVF